jgi:predicted TIM-barrel fold metal-dependent hydrolase
MEDTRTQHPSVQAPPVELEPLMDLLTDLPDLRVVIQNHRSEIHRDLVSKLAGTVRVYFDIARAEQVGSIEHMLGEISADRILFGSHSPFFYFEAARLKMEESELTDTQRVDLLRRNAERLLEALS